MNALWKWLKEKVWGTGRLVMGCAIFLIPELLFYFKGYTLGEEAANLARTVGGGLAGVGLVGKLTWLKPYMPMILDALFKRKAETPKETVAAIPAPKATRQLSGIVTPEKPKGTHSASID